MEMYGEAEIQFLTTTPSRKEPQYALDRRMVIGQIGLDATVTIKISHSARNQIPAAQPVA
jgi:hypothetical protein